MIEGICVRPKSVLGKICVRPKSDLGLNVCEPLSKVPKDVNAPSKLFMILKCISKRVDT